ncbi:discoidin domain-containing protein [Paenibacillus taichungensis]
MASRSKRRAFAGKGLAIALIAALFTTLFPGFVPSKAQAEPASYLLSSNRPAYASSTEGNNTANLAVDGSSGTRWSSAWGKDPQWLYVDLGDTATIDKVRIQWEGAYAKAYQVQVSTDEVNWTDIYNTATGNGGTDELTVNGSGRYVRVLGTERALANYGYSIIELEVYGTGGTGVPPVTYGPDVAQGKQVTVSSYEQSDYLPPGATLPENAVDGNSSTRWGSNHTDDEWIYVDLGSKRNIGRVVLNWEGAAGRAFDLQVSDDANAWTTVYRELHGNGGKQDISMYASGRYVKMQGIGRATNFGYSLFDFEVYDYVEGTPKPSYPIPELPSPSTVQVGKGSYLTNDIRMPQPKYPSYKTDNVQAPIASNDWWQSLLIKPLSDSIITLPLKSKFYPQGLGLLNPGEGWINGDGSAVNADGNPDLYFMSTNINANNMETRVSGYSDYAVDTILSDDASAKMKTTFVKGSPYVFMEFNNPNTAEIFSSLITKVVNGNGETVLQSDGDTFTGDHIGIQLENQSGDPAGEKEERYYGIFAPEGTVFKKAGAKIKLQLGGGKGYLSAATMPSLTDLNQFHEHAYAFVTNTEVTYNYNEQTSTVTTNFKAETEVKRPGFSANTLQALYPHQWKITNSPLTSLTYPSIRGTLKVREGNQFTVEDHFYGMVPQFTEPTNAEYNREEMVAYLEMLKAETDNNLMAADAYWQGKKLHPLAMGVLAANEMGETVYRDLFLSRMKEILVDWYTYTAGEPDYFLYYNDDWGTMYYKTSEFGANYGITDHHFTYGYYVFASAVLATFDKQFQADYGDMVDHLIRDYGNPSKNDPLYPSFRSFDPYQGHSWAGGYADNDSGNNQEAAGESLFGWVGQYMWSVLTKDQDFRDAAIYGFTTELKAIEQYWFNYDGDNWLDEWKHASVGQVYGSSYFFGTFFSGEPVHIYGIHWLPTSEYLTSYGLDKTKAAGLYNGFVADNGGPEREWQHIVWPIQALSDPAAVLAKWNASSMQKNEIFNTYWFVNSMATLGERTKDIWATGWSSATVYKKNGAYTAQIWNPTDESVTVTFKNASGTTGKAVVGPKSLVRVDPTQNTEVSDSWIPWNGENGGNEGGEDGGDTNVNFALNKNVTVSSTEEPFVSNNAVDGNPETRWSSGFGDTPEWITIDLGEAKQVKRIKLNWEAAYATAYRIDVSEDGTVWKEVYHTQEGKGGLEELAVNGKGKYVRLTGEKRATQYGYSLYEVEVYGRD